MKLSDFLSDEQLGAMRSVTSGKSPSETLCPSLTDRMRDNIHVFMGKHDCVPFPDFWQVLERNRNLERNVVVHITHGKAEIVELQKCVTFAKHLGELLKKGGGLLFVMRQSTIEITWANWRETYTRLTTVPVKDNTPAQPTSYERRQIRNRRKRERLFRECAAVDMPKKMGKRGFNMSVNEHFAMRKLQEIEDEQRSVLYQAKKIYEECI